MNTSKQETTSLTVLAQHNFELVPFDAGIADMIAEEMDGLGTIPFDMIKIPSGGGLAFELPGETEDTPVTVGELAGIIVDHHPMNVYWEGEYDGSNNQPDCSSFDGKTAVDSKTGEVKSCASCPLNQFGSDAKGGKGKACKNMHRIYILLTGQPLPMLLTLPPTSLSAWKNYLGKKIVIKGKRPYMTLTKITLKRVKNSNGIAYSEAVFSKIDDLSAEEIAAIQPMLESIRAMTKSVAAMQLTETFSEVKSSEFIEIGDDKTVPF